MNKPSVHRVTGFQILYVLRQNQSLGYFESS